MSLAAGLDGQSLRGGQQGDDWDYQRGEAREMEKVGRTRAVVDTMAVGNREDGEMEDVGSRWKDQAE
jgi:hypothetical protein